MLIRNQELRIFVGSVSLMEDYHIVIEEHLRKQVGEYERQGKTIIWVASQPLIPNSKFIIHGFIALADVIREESREAINSLRAMGIKTAMITGDSEDVARWVAGELGIDEYFARVLPGEKAEIVKTSRRQGDPGASVGVPLRVAMVGDGINDAGADAGGCRYRHRRGDECGDRIRENYFGGTIARYPKDHSSLAPHVC